MLLRVCMLFRCDSWRILSASWLLAVDMVSRLGRLDAHGSSGN